MKIIYTKHAIKKFKDLEELDVYISKKLIRKILTEPLHIEKQTDNEKIIVSGNIDKSHVLRIVYKVEDDIITVITFYPARKGRYYL